MTTNAKTQAPSVAANDNETSPSVQVDCDVPDALGIIPGEIELLVRHLGDIEAMSAANDNEPEIP